MPNVLLFVKDNVAKPILFYVEAVLALLSINGAGDQLVINDAGDKLEL